MTQSDEMEKLIQDLQGLSVPDPGDVFFQRQAQQIQNRILAEDEALIHGLREIPMEDAGESFFQRQFLEIQHRISRTPAGLPAIASATAGPRSRLLAWRDLWLRPMIAVAAVLLLVFGLSRMDVGRNTSTTSEPQQVAGPANMDDLWMDLMGVDGLDSVELEHLAGRLEGTLSLHTDGPWSEDSLDWDELSGEELDQLIQNIKTEVRT
jgi:hypothetical protein